MVVEESSLSSRKRSRSFSVGCSARDDLQMKYWALLFENLRRSVDEIYSVCETGQHIVECKEVVTLLETYMNDFKNLIKWLQSKREVDSTHILKRHNRPAWEIRKSTLAIKSTSKSKTGASTDTAPVQSQEKEVAAPVAVPVVPAVAETVSNTEQPSNTADKKDEKYTPSMVSSDNSSASLETTVTKIKVNVSTATVARVQDKPTVTSKYSSAVNRNVAAVQSPVTVKKPIVKKPEVGVTRGVKPLQQLRSAISSSRLVSRTATEKREAIVSKPASQPKPVTVKPVSALKEQQRRFGVSVEDLPSNATGVYEEGSHGWEMVRGRPRLKNSPPKTLLKDRSTSQSVTDLSIPRSAPSLLQRAKTVIAPFLSPRSQRDAPLSPKVKKAPSRSLYEKAPSFRTEVPRKRVVQEASKTLPRQKKPLLKVSPKTTRKDIKEEPKDKVKPDGGTGMAAPPPPPESQSDKATEPVAGTESQIAAEVAKQQDSNVPVSLEKLEFEPDVLIPILVCESVTPTAPLSREGSKLEKPEPSEDEDTNNLSQRIVPEAKEDKNIGDMLLAELLGIDQSTPEPSTTLDGSEVKVEAVIDTADDIPVKEEGGDSELASGLATPRDDESLLDEKEMEEHDAAWEMALREEACLHQQMMEAEGTDTDTDPDDMSNLDVSSSGEDGSLTSSQPQLLFEGMSWSEEVELSEHGDLSHISRAAFEVHEKLSSPSRRRIASPDKAFRQIEERQARASRLRKQLFEEKAMKRKELQRKIDEVRDAKDRLIEQKRHLLERKMKRADEKRQHYLADIVRKAHDEEQKLRELAFINELEAQNKRIDFITSCQSHEERLHGLQEERQRKHEEKAAKDAAVEERKKALEAERQAKLAEIQERRRRKEEKIDRENQEKAKHKEELIREKQRDRQERLSALQAAHQATVEELQKKIQLKQEEYARRHEENIENIKHRASELAVPRFPNTPEEAPLLAPYERKRFCTLCNVLISSEIQLLSHIRGRLHQEAVKNGNAAETVGGDQLFMGCIVDTPPDVELQVDNASKELKKTYAKRLKKIRNRMLQRSSGNKNDKPLPDNLKKSRMNKLVSNIDRVVGRQAPGHWDASAVTQVERSVDELLKILSKEGSAEQFTFQSLDGFHVLSRAFLTSVPEGTALGRARCSESLLICLRRSICDNFLVSAKLLIDHPPLAYVDLLVKRLEALLANPSQTSTSQLSIVTTLPSDSISCGILSVISSLLNAVSLHCPCSVEVRSEESVTGIDLGILKQQTLDLISYLVCSGLVDWISVLCSRCQSPLEGDIDTATLLTASFRCLHAAVDCLFQPQNGKKIKNPQDAGGLIEALKESELVGILNTLYGILLHQGSLSRGSQSPLRHSAEILSVVSSGIRLLICFARLDLKSFQAVLSTEGISLQFRHISSHLLRFCGRDGPSPLLDNLIICIGYFTVGHNDNQTIIQSGQQPSVLQQLCQLPFVYFSDPSRRLVLFPTLLACSLGSTENKAILEQEMNYEMLEDFLLLPDSCRSHLVGIIKSLGIR